MKPTPSRFVFPPHIRTTLANGLTAVWIEHHDQPAFTLMLLVPGGSFEDPSGKEGTAALACSLMSKGSRMYSPRQYAEALELKGAAVFTDVDDEYMIIGLQALVKYADELIPLFWQTVLTPCLDEKEFFRLRRETIAGLQAELADPESIADRHFYTRLFGKLHPAGRVRTVRTVRRIKLNDVRDFIRRCIDPRGSCLVFVGDCDLNNARRRWEPLFESWRSIGEQPQRSHILAPPPALGRTEIFLVEKPSLTQTSLIVGHCAPGEKADDVIALSLANYVFGGGNFSSRLTTHLRSRLGRTYSVCSHLTLNSNFGSFAITTSTNNKHVAEVLDVILDEYRNLTRYGVSTEEVENAKRYMIGSKAFQFEGINNIADQILWLHFYGRDIAYIENFSATVSAISRDQVQEAILRYLTSPFFVIGAVGPWQELLSQLSKFGSVDVVDFRSDP